MNRVFVSIVLVFVTVGVLLLIQATRTGTSQVLMPSELLEREGEMLPRIRVAGRVAAKRVDYQVEPMISLRFQISDPGTDNNQPKTVPVVYNGLKPDMFAPGRDVIIDGEFREGELHASKLLTQCPSKYEPPSPAAGQEGYKPPLSKP